MADGRRSRLIWLVDRRDYWRERYARALGDAGYRVKSWERYRLPGKGLAHLAEEPTLVVLACTEVGDPEWDLVTEMVSRRHRLVVLASSLSAPVMRSLFRAGAEDVAETPASGGELVELVADRLGTDPEPDSSEPLLHLRAR